MHGHDRSADSGSVTSTTKVFSAISGTGFSLGLGFSSATTGRTARESAAAVSASRRFRLSDMGNLVGSGVASEHRAPALCYGRRPLRGEDSAYVFPPGGLAFVAQGGSPVLACGSLRLLFQDVELRAGRV